MATFWQYWPRLHAWLLREGAYHLPVWAMLPDGAIGAAVRGFF